MTMRSIQIQTQLRVHGDYKMAYYQAVAALKLWERHTCSITFIERNVVMKHTQALIAVLNWRESVEQSGFIETPKSTKHHFSLSPYIENVTEVVLDTLCQHANSWWKSQSSPIRVAWRAGEIIPASTSFQEVPNTGFCVSKRVKKLEHEVQILRGQIAQKPAAHDGHYPSSGICKGICNRD